MLSLGFLLSPAEALCTPAVRQRYASAVRQRYASGTLGLDGFGLDGFGLDGFGPDGFGLDGFGRIPP